MAKYVKIMTISFQIPHKDNLNLQINQSYKVIYRLLMVTSSITKKLFNNFFKMTKI